MYDGFEVSKVLVIAPPRVAEDTWSREGEKWDHLWHLRISRVLGSAKQRRAAPILYESMEREAFNRKLLQIAGGAVYDEDYAAHELHADKKTPLNSLRAILSAKLVGR